MKRAALLSIITIFFLTASCKKDNITTNIPAHLTEKLWTLDTIVINSPLTFDALTDQQKFDYTASLGWAKGKAQITFNNDGSVTCGGDWDFAYTHWQLQNDDQDLRMTQGNAGYDTLRSWQASAGQFSYAHTLSAEPFDCTYIYK